jgi:hypothetical protein
MMTSLLVKMLMGGEILCFMIRRVNVLESSTLHEGFMPCLAKIYSTMRLASELSGSSGFLKTLCGNYLLNPLDPLTESQKCGPNRYMIASSKRLR